jgi:hypothetical protein
MPPFSSLFPELPPPPQWASWADLQQIEIARAQAYWARDQAQWAHWSVWVQIAGLIAASLAAAFAWQAARASREQADAAQSELRELSSLREAESRVRAWQLREHLQVSFRLPSRQGDNATLPDQIRRLFKSDTPLNKGKDRQSVSADIGISGLRLAAGISSEKVVPLWIALMDSFAVLRLLEPRMSMSRSLYLMRASDSPENELVFPDAEKLREEWSRQSDDVPIARAELERFLAKYRELFDHVDAIARGGNLAATARVSVTATATLT